MRRKEREITNTDEILDILRSCKVCSLAMISAGKPYIVPMNFGFELPENGALTLYFHSALEGRKIEALKAAPEVCFEMDDHHAVFGKEVACSYSFAYRSIIGSGIVSFINDANEKRRAFDFLMAQVTGRTDGWEYSDKALARTCMFCVRATEFTAKGQSLPKPQQSPSA